MKTFRLLIFAAVFYMFVGLSLTAQETSNQSEIYALSVPLHTVYEHPEGYRVRYSKNNLHGAETYIPRRWINEKGRKAELIYSKDYSVPYMIVFYKDGVFSHVRLYIHPDRNHYTWGYEGTDIDYSSRFSADALEIEL